MHCLPIRNSSWNLYISHGISVGTDISRKDSAPTPAVGLLLGPPMFAARTNSRCLYPVVGGFIPAAVHSFKITLTVRQIVTALVVEFVLGHRPKKRNSFPRSYHVSCMFSLCCVHKEVSQEHCRIIGFASTSEGVVKHPWKYLGIYLKTSMYTTYPSGLSHI